jgi:ferredoxin-type protein NapH
VAKYSSRRLIPLCIDCGKCNSVCPMELDVRSEIGGAECIACGDCKKACPQEGGKRTVGI